MAGVENLFAKIDIKKQCRLSSTQNCKCKRVLEKELIMSKQDRIIRAVVLLYAAFILYFMFFAFGRTNSSGPNIGYTFIFSIENFFKLPNPSDYFPPTVMDLVGLGNVAAFIPFGILIPMLYRIKFVRFLVGFMLVILVLETVQALTFLGSFDINDVLTNALGAAIGFGAYAAGSRVKTMGRSFVVMGISVVVMLIGVWGIGAGVDQIFAKKPGPVIALNQLEDSSGNAVKGTTPYVFNIGGEELTPESNVYDATGKKSETYRYNFNKKEVYFYFQYGISDPDNFDGRISAWLDGHQIFSNSEEFQSHAPELFEWHSEEADELVITIEGNEKMWDIGYREMQHFWE